MWWKTLGNKKQNCWQVMDCGRYKKGHSAEKLGVCPVCMKDKDSNKINDGKRAGRICWAIAGSMCGGEKVGTFAKDLMNCIDCKFFKQVKEEEGENFKLVP